MSAVDKGPWRSALRNYRRGRTYDPTLKSSLAGRGREALAAFDIPADAPIASFEPTPTEPDISELNRSLPHVILPVVARDHDGAVIPEPDWTGPLEDAALIFVPALAADALGTRLGQGGGWYDRALATLDTPPPVVAVVFDHEFIEDRPLPRQRHDVPVDGVLTPTRFVLLRPRPRQ